MLAKPHHPVRQSGFTLLEILIAIVILSVGLLGLAGLQARSLQANQSALMRSQATVLAYDILDRMRANRATARAGGYDQNMADAAPASGTIQADDVISWLDELSTRLPGGDGAIQVNTDVVTITVQWDDRRASAASDAEQTAAETQQFVVESRL